MEKTFGSLKTRAKLVGVGVKGALIGKFNKDLGRNYLVQALSKMPGLPAKSAQFLRTRFDIEELQYVTPLEETEVRKILEEQTPGFAKKIRKFVGSPKLASLSQVQRVATDDGQEFAVKVQFPNVGAEIESQLEFFLDGFAKRGPGKKFGVDVDDYRGYLRAHFTAELDYEIEGRVQNAFYERWKESHQFAIPKVYPEYSSKQVLVQSYEESKPLQAAKENSELSQLLTQFYFNSVFGTGLVHSDWHSGNLGFRERNGKIQLVIYDFGSFLQLDPKKIRTLYEFVTNSEQSYAALQSLGFDSKKLERIKDRMPELSRLVAEPTGSDHWNPLTWDLAKKLDDLLGPEKWWFRTAGPPWFLMLMRSFHGYLEGLKTLKCSDVDIRSHFSALRFSYSHLLDSFVPDDQSSGENSFESDEPDLSGISALRVSVSETQNGRESEVVALTMPAFSLTQLEDLVPPETRLKIEAQGLDLVEIKTEAIKHPKPQVLFEASTGVRNYKVWLE